MGLMDQLNTRPWEQGTSAITGQPQMTGEEVLKAYQQAPVNHLLKLLTGEPQTGLMKYGYETMMPWTAAAPQVAGGKLTPDLNPVEAFDKTLNPYGLMFQAPEIDLTYGEIASNAPRGILQSVRKVMAAENAARGAKLPALPKFESSEAVKRETGKWAKKFQESGDPYDLHMMEEISKTGKPRTPVTELVDEVSRGVWLHGRGTYPQTGETFKNARFKTGNLGEPAGMSLTADKGLLERNFAKLPKGSKGKMSDDLKGKLSKYVNVENDNFLSEMDVKTLKEKYNVPENVAWDFQNEKIKGGGQAPFARVFPKFGGPPSEKILPAWKAPETEWAQDVLKDAYEEAAVKMIKDMPNGADNLVVKNVAADPNRLMKPFLQTRSDEFNKEISQILQKKGYKALLYSPGRYNEYELRMLNPDDVVMLDMRTQGDKALERMNQVEHFIGNVKGSQTKRLEKWGSQTSGAPSSLGDIYDDIDFSDILKKAH